MLLNTELQSHNFRDHYMGEYSRNQRRSHAQGGKTFLRFAFVLQCLRWLQSVTHKYFHPIPLRVPSTHPRQNWRGKNVCSDSRFHRCFPFPWPES